MSKWLLESLLHYRANLACRQGEYRMKSAGRHARKIADYQKKQIAGFRPSGFGFETIGQIL
jgi:hypothetical protein